MILIIMTKVHFVVQIGQCLYFQDKDNFRNCPVLVERGINHPNEYAELINVTNPCIDHHVNELGPFQIFLDCIGYQQ